HNIFLSHTIVAKDRKQEGGGRRERSMQMQEERERDSDETSYCVGILPVHMGTGGDGSTMIDD
ncbi:hypothetical protein BaRGS_00012438, partial [Batillaria attramentaria]